MNKLAASVPFEDRVAAHVARFAPAVQHGDSSLTDFSHYRDRPVEFCREVLGDRLWSKQIEILEGMAQHRRLTIRSCHGAGKTWTLARGLIWFTRTRPGAIAISTAPTWRQVKDLLWREINSAVNGSRQPLGGQLNQTGWNLGDRWYALGMSTDQPERFQGYHAAIRTADDRTMTDEEFWSLVDQDAEQSGNIMLMVDEASGVGEPIFEASRGFMTTPGSITCYAANPTRTDGTFWKSHRPDSLYHKIKISAFDAPQRLISPEWIEEQRIDYGEDSPFYAVRVLGEFPQEGPNSLFPMWLLEAAADQTVDLWGNPLETGGPVEFGVDVAAEGADETCIVGRQGCRVLFVDCFREPDTTKSVDRVMDLVAKWHPSTIRVDAGAMGKAIIDPLRRRARDQGQSGLMHGIHVLSIHFGGRALDTGQFLMARDEMFWSLSRRFRDRQVTGLTDQKACGELAPMLFETDGREKIKVESKDDMAKRGLKSPNRADAMALAFYGRRRLANLAENDPDAELSNPEFSEVDHIRAREESAWQEQLEAERRADEARAAIGDDLADHLASLGVM